MTWDELRQIHSWLPVSSEGWHQHNNGGGWVEDTAYVAATVQVCGEAQVCGNARVYGEAQVYGNARVCGEAAITPIYIQGTRFGVCWSGDNLVSSGCITRPIDWWLSHVETCAAQHDCSELQQREYRLHVEHIAAWMRLHGLNDKLTPPRERHQPGE
ncbi:MAG: hypothetical protein ABII82_05460 [Verrucomicrobiota bacterium]